MLDMMTATISYAFSSALTLGCAVLFWYQNREYYRGLDFWVGASATQTLGLVLTLLRDTLPAAVALGFGNMLLVVGLFLIYIGLEQFTGTVGSHIRHYLLLAAFMAFNGYYTLVRPEISMRVIVISVALTILAVDACLLLLARVGIRLRGITRPLGYLLAVYALVSLLRIAGVFLGPSTTDWFHAPSHQSLGLAMYQVLGLALTFGLFLTVTRRLREDEQEQLHQRQRVEKSLHESEARQSAIFRASPVGISLTRFPDGLVRDANDAFFDVLGQRREDIIGCFTTELDLWVSTGARENLIKDVASRGSVQDTEVQLRRKNGEIIDALLSVELVDIQGERYVLTITRDITERKRAEREREEIIAKLQSALSQVKTLRGLLPICSSCKKIRNDNGYWQQVEVYIKANADVEFSHGICPECMARLYPYFPGQ